MKRRLIVKVMKQKRICAFQTIKNFPINKNKITLYLHVVSPSAHALARNLLSSFLNPNLNIPKKKNNDSFCLSLVYISLAPNRSECLSRYITAVLRKVNSEWTREVQNNTLLNVICFNKSNCNLYSFSILYHFIKIKLLNFNQRLPEQNIKLKALKPIK